jgi:lysozyme family protein
MKSNFAAALKIELTYEGGKDDDPVDPGGRTNQGIIQRVYAAYRIRKGLPARDVFLMDDSERDEIYRTQYFDKIRFDELPPGLDLVIVDGAINSGVSQSIKWVQRALNLTADGVLGDVTMQRIQDHPDHDMLIRGILDRRRAFLKALKTFWRFGKGWIARVNNLEKKGQAWAMGSVGPTVTFIPNANKKASLVDAKPAPVRAIADATASGGAVSTTLSTVQGVFEPLQGNAYVDKILLGIVVVGAIATVGGLVWGMYARRKTEERADVLDLVAVQQASANNDNVPDEVLSQYVDPDAQGSETGNIAPGHITTSGRKAGDTEERAA